MAIGACKTFGFRYPHVGGAATGLRKPRSNYCRTWPIDRFSRMLS